VFLEVSIMLRKWVWLGATVLLYTAAAAAVTPQEGEMIARLAERGSSGAQVLLAGMYLRGDGGVARDPAQAASWFEKAAEQGNAYAELKLGDLYAAGEGVAKDAAIAATWREKAANRGNVVAQRLLGKMYLEGDGVAQDNRKAEYWLNRAVLEGKDAEAEYLLARMHRAGRTAKPDQKVANDLLAGAAAQHHEGAFELLNLLKELGYSIEESLHQRPPHLQKLAKEGDVEAQYQLGLRLENAALGGAAEHREAVEWFQKAADKGHVMAMKSLAHIYATGIEGVAADPEKAAYWRQKAGEK
jgi:TPR repeat protein